MRFPESFLTELKSRVRLSDVVGRKVRLKRQGKDLVGLSPFSNEKTPSFHVHDDRGFYKCFSTQKGGDAITFLMETERLTFAEAVEKLAAEVGLDLPRQSAEEQQTWRKRATLMDWTEKAAAFFEDQLRGPGGADARAYLEMRGFGRDAWTRHRMGFAPAGWRNLSDHLTKQGAPVEDLVAAGLLVEPDDAGGSNASGGKKQPYDRFRNRVIFPISDPSGKVIAFGARTLEPDGKPKYLNSSDSELFHKGRTLYRLGPAREALAQLAQTKDQDIRSSALARGLIVTEGYVDAIALAEVGIGTAVAPLGTALTEEQLDLLWRAGPEPILCFDGDEAGARAAFRALDRALPLIEPGRTLYFVMLPAGMDPDDVVRARGADFMRGLLNQAKPLVDLLWMREFDAAAIDTPERRAGFEARLMDAVGRIKHAGVRKAYERELRDRLYQHFRPGRSAPGGPGAAGRQTWTKGESPGATGKRGLRLIVRAIESPEILEHAREAASRAVFDDPDVVAIRDAAFYVLDNTESLDRAAVAAHLRSLGRKRAVELLETMPVMPSMDPRSGEGRGWLDALERFPVSAAIAGEARSTVQGEDGAEVLSAAHEARIRAMVIDRWRIGRSGVEEAASGSASDGSQSLRAALGGMKVAMEQRRPED